jgi:hypothetical protein
VSPTGALTCPILDLAAQNFGTAALKASLKAKIDAFYNHSTCATVLSIHFDSGRAS